jgi:hypothetical protein
MAKNSLMALLDFTEVMTFRPLHIQLNSPSNNLTALAPVELGLKDYEEKVGAM